MLACPECRKLHPNDATTCAEHGVALVPLESLSDEDAPLASGKMMGEYRLDRKLGSGTFGAVYAGEQPMIGKRVAIKVLHKKFASNSGVVSRFITEARAVNRIRHKNIIDIFSFGLVDDQQPYFVMELLDGVTLGELLEKNGRLGVAEALPILRGIADALDAAHEVGVTHRDLKPDNIFLAEEKDGSYFPKLLDFGVAKLLAEELAHKTATGAAIGTPSYMAPEQCRGKPIDHRADIYALGVVIHEMLTGQRLFEGDSGMEVLFMHASLPPKPMSHAAPDLPEALDEPVLAMLAKRPDQRPDSAGKAIAALVQRAVECGAIEAAPTTAPGAIERAIARRTAPTASEQTAAVAAVSGELSAPSDAASTRKGGIGAPTETSGPVVISVDGDAAIVDGDMPSAHTMLAPASTTLPTAGTPLGVVAAHAPDPTVADDSVAGEPPRAPRRSEPAERAKRAPWWPIAAVIAVGAGTFAVARRGPAPAPAVTSAPAASASAPAASELPSKVTIKLTVTPADADLILDGVRVGSANEPLVLPRSTQSRPLRVEKKGYEGAPVWILPDRDQELPPISLRELPPEEPIPTAAPVKAPVKAAPKAPGHDDVELPVYPHK